MVADSAVADTDELPPRVRSDSRVLMAFKP
jgi:hypothetical protein